MPVGSLPAFNSLGGNEAQREAPKKEAVKKASEEKSGFSHMSELWEHATGKKDRDRKGEKGGLAPQVGNLWDSATGKKRDKSKDKDSLGFFGGSKKKSASSINWGPGGAAGIGCGVGIGVGLTGGAGIGATPWSSLRIVFGVGAGCGLGVGYGFGYGMGLRWDKPPEESSKRLVIAL